MCRAAEMVPILPGYVTDIRSTTQQNANFALNKAPLPISLSGVLWIQGSHCFPPPEMWVNLTTSTDRLLGSWTESTSSVQYLYWLPSWLLADGIGTF